MPTNFLTKNKNQMKTTSFIEKCQGIALVVSSVALLLFGAATLVYSTTPAQADAPQTMYATGKYQMALTSVRSSDGTIFWYILAWDSETGRSKMYYGNTSSGTNAAHSKYQLPSSPL